MLEHVDLKPTTRNRPRRMRRIVQRTLVGGKAEARCTYSKVCKNTLGLKIHQAKSQCGNLSVSESSQGSNGEEADEREC